MTGTISDTGAASQGPDPLTVVSVSDPSLNQTQHNGLPVVSGHCPGCSCRMLVQYRDQSPIDVMQLPTEVFMRSSSSTVEVWKVCAVLQSFIRISKTADMYISTKNRSSGCGRISGQLPRTYQNKVSFSCCKFHCAPIGCGVL